MNSQMLFKINSLGYINIYFIFSNMYYSGDGTKRNVLKGHDGK